MIHHPICCRKYYTCVRTYLIHLLESLMGKQCTPQFEIGYCITHCFINSYSNLLLLLPTLGRSFHRFPAALLSIITLKLFLEVNDFEDPRRNSPVMMKGMVVVLIFIFSDFIMNENTGALIRQVILIHLESREQLYGSSHTL